MPSILLKSLIVLVLLAALTGAAQEQYPLRRIIITDSEQSALAITDPEVPDQSVLVQDVPLLDDPNLRKALEGFLGQTIGGELLNAIANKIVEHARNRDRLIARVLVPVQPVATGTLRLAVVIGRYNQLSFQGNQRFSRSLLERRMGIQPGEEVRLSVLEEAVNWTNTNPFRQVKVRVNDLPNEPGKADLLVAVEERRPYRFAASVDNTGNQIIGKRRIALVAQFGNLWGEDHQGSYQYLTTDQPDVYQAHLASYRVPLAWRHFLDLSGIYSLVSPSFEQGLFQQKGETVVADVKYTIPLKSGREPRDFSFGVNFKQSNNNLEYGGTQVRGTSTNTFQVYTSFSLLERDSRGAWLLAATLNASPGGLNSRNDDDAYQTARLDASSRYLYGSLSLQRLFSLPKGWDLFSRLTGQLSSTNLLPNEQLTVGGATTVRGYRDNTFAGDQGVVLSNELLSPVIRYSPTFVPKRLPPLEARVLGFLDAAKVEYTRRIASDLNLSSMASVGLGARANVGSSFSFSFDYGWQLLNIAKQPGQASRQPLSSRGHIKAVLAF
jgi:hemolysin activation/secretion protein